MLVPVRVPLPKRGLVMDLIGFVKKKILYVIPAAALVFSLGVYFVLFAPLLVELQDAYVECRSCENDVIETRNVIGSAGAVPGSRVLRTEEDVDHVIDELTRHGRLKGVNIVSMSPLRVRKETIKGAQYKVLPVEMELESTYKQLAVVLGELDDLKKGLVKIESFDVKPDEADPSKFITGLVVDIYLSAR